MSANILNNNIGAEQAHNLATVLKDHAMLKSLCGNTGDETELDMSGKEMGADGAIMLAPEIVANGALVKFDVSKNSLNADGCKAIANTLKGNATMSELKIASNDMTWGGDDFDDMSAVSALANAIPTMGALTSLNISNNSLGGYWEEDEETDARPCQRPTDDTHTQTTPGTGGRTWG